MRRNDGEHGGAGRVTGAVARGALGLALAATLATSLAGCVTSGAGQGPDEGDEVVVEDVDSDASVGADVDDESEDATPVDAADASEDAFVPLELSDLDLDAIPSADGRTETFSLAGGRAPELDPEDLAFIEECVGDVERYGDVSLVLVNIGTGAGIACNTDALVYGASSFKGPYCAYLCSRLVDARLVSLDGL